MKYFTRLIMTVTVLLFSPGGINLAVAATTPEQAETRAEASKQQAQLKAEQQSALFDAEEKRKAAEVSIVKAQKQLEIAAQEREKAAIKEKQARASRQAELVAMQRELQKARRQLRETSRELSRVNRDLAQVTSEEDSSSFVIHSSGHPVIGVILGDSNDVGVEVLGVSPDGPAEKAGIRQGDVIIAMGGRVLATIDEDGDARKGLKRIMQDVKVDEPMIISVERKDQTLDLSVVPEIREPLTWQFDTRFPTAPTAPSAPTNTVRIDRIVVPEIDTEALGQQIEQIRVEIAERGALMESGEWSANTDDYELEFHDLSEMGDLALHDANVWFGLPLAQGLKLAEIDPDLGEYFKTDHGVLVLKARPDNDLQLESGDVVLQLGNTLVNTPSEFMRVLRDFHAGDKFEIKIKRKRKTQVLDTTMPDANSRLIDLEPGKKHHIKIISKRN